MDKINYSKNAWEDEENILVPVRATVGEDKILPWRSYCSQKQCSDTTSVGGLPKSVHWEPCSSASSRKWGSLEPKYSAAPHIKSCGGSAKVPLGSLLAKPIIPLGIIAGFSILLHFIWPLLRSPDASPYNLLYSWIFSRNRAAIQYAIPTKSLSQEDIWQNWKAELNTETSYLEKNEALVLLLKRYGLDQKQSSNLVMSVEEDVDLTRLRVEDPIQLFFTNEIEKELVGFQIEGREKTVNAYLYQGKAKNEIEYHELRAKTFQAVVKVEHSLYQDGIDQNIPASILLDMFNRYSYDINFQSDIQRGTRYEIVYTMIYNEKDKRVGTGEILYANIVLGHSDGSGNSSGRSFPIFNYTDLLGKSEFFNVKGRSVSKMLLLMPVNGAYVSSNFGYRRDPILGNWRFHRGTDYAAPRGTPIKAGGTGKIIVRGWSRIGYGYHIIIRHRNGYDTLYGHMSRFQPGYRVGSRVRQGDIIGYVGSTGRSTGPHVHYEVRRYGKPVGLRSLRLQSSRDLAGQNKRLFENSIRALQARFTNLLPDLQQINLPAGNSPANLVKNQPSSKNRNKGAGT